jgi:hypothetical protein
VTAPDVAGTTPAVAHCPVCGADTSRSNAFVQEYWTGHERNFLTWCPGCRQMCIVTIADRVVLSEPEH